LKLIEQIMEPETAGDPMGKSLNWTRKSAYSLSKTLKEKDINISPNTAGKALKQLGYSLKSNRKSISTTQHPDRNQQFQFIESKVKEYEDTGQPIISVDTKKKELIGNFSNTGKKYCIGAEKTLDHDFLSNALGKIAPYGIYEKLTNKGTVVLGTSKETPEFAVDAIETWLTNIAFKNYPNMQKLLILCDSGGSNGYRKNGWKYYLYTKLALVHGIDIQVCHYPSGSSKWNPIEHKMFSFISKNWEGVPLRTYQVAMNYIESTNTTKGLAIKAFLNQKEYQAGITFDKLEVENSIRIKKEEILPQWNYSILSNKNSN
jgi:hypothetical protein